MEPIARKKLLILDDEPNILKALTRSLKPYGFDVESTTDPNEALDLIKRNNIKVVVSDHQMPIMTGSEFLKRVLAISPDSYRLILSGYADFDTIMKSVNTGDIDKFISKPWDETQLAQLLNEAFKLQALKSNKAFTHAETGFHNESYLQANLDAFLDDETEKGNVASVALIEFTIQNKDISFDLDAFFKDVVAKNLKLWNSLLSAEPIYISPTEYTLLIPNIKNRFALNYVARDLQREFARPIPYKGQEIQLRLSIGLAIQTAQESGQRLIKLAEQALERSKLDTKNNYFIYPFFDEKEFIQRIFNSLSKLKTDKKPGIGIHLNLSRFRPLTRLPSHMDNPRHAFDQILKSFKGEYWVLKRGDIAAYFDNINKTKLQEIILKFKNHYMFDTRLSSSDEIDFYTIYNLQTDSRNFLEETKLLVQKNYPFLIDQIRREINELEKQSIEQQKDLIDEEIKKLNNLEKFVELKKYGPSIQYEKVRPDIMYLSFDHKLVQTEFKFDKLFTNYLDATLDLSLLENLHQNTTTSITTYIADLTFQTLESFSFKDLSKYFTNRKIALFACLSLQEFFAQNQYNLKAQEVIKEAKPYLLIQIPNPQALNTLNLNFISKHHLLIQIESFLNDQDVQILSQLKNKIGKNTVFFELKRENNKENIDALKSIGFTNYFERAPKGLVKKNG